MSSLLKLEEFRISWEELRKLPDDQLAAFGLVCFAISEINVLKRLYLFSGHDYDPVGIDEIGFAALSQRLVLLRLWSAKLFELTKFFKFEGQHNRTKDQTLLSLSEIAQKTFEDVAKGPGFEFATRQRNEAASHYHMKSARKNAHHLRKDALCNMYLHQAEGNSFFPLGEELMFGASVLRLKDEFTCPDSDIVDEWFRWNLEANNWASKMHVQLFSETILKVIPDRKPYEREYWLKPEMIQYIGECIVPVFLRKDPIA